MPGPYLSLRQKPCSARQDCQKNGNIPDLLKQFPKMSKRIPGNQLLPPPERVNVSTGSSMRTAKNGRHFHIVQGIVQSPFTSFAVSLTSVVPAFSAAFLVITG